MIEKQISFLSDTEDELLDDFQELYIDDLEVNYGDIFKLGNHKLMCGDATITEDVDKLLQGNKADMAFTDPPYNVLYTGGIQIKNGNFIKNNREMIVNDNIDIYEDVFKQLSKYIDGPAYIWFAGSKAENVYKYANKYGNIHALIIWIKNGGFGALNANYKQKHEPCLYWKPNNSNLRWVGQSTETTIWNINKDGLNNYHPTQKPVKLAIKAIKNHDVKTVIDLFGGSGSTLIACEITKRNCYMMELDPQYVKVIIRRWEKFTGGQHEKII